MEAGRCDARSGSISGIPSISALLGKRFTDGFAGSVLGIQLSIGPFVNESFNGNRAHDMKIDEMQTHARPTTHGNESPDSPEMFWLPM
jgi:hypothetical protein